MKLTRQMIVLDPLAVGSVPVHDGYCFVGNRPLQALRCVPLRRSSFAAANGKVRIGRHCRHGSGTQIDTRLAVPPRPQFSEKCANFSRSAKFRRSSSAASRQQATRPTTLPTRQCHPHSHPFTSATPPASVAANPPVTPNIVHIFSHTRRPNTAGWSFREGQ